MENKYIENDPLDDLMWEVRLKVRKEMLGIAGNSSLALLGPEMVDAVSEYGLRAPSPYRRVRN